jgi:hypothetical protein
MLQNASTAQARADQARNRNSVNVIKYFWAQGFAGRGQPFPHEQIQKHVERHFMLRPPRCVSRQSVAVHESAHFVLAHLEKIGAAAAEIYGSRHDWGGEMRPWSAPCPTDPHELCGSAYVAVAGPIAVELLGDGSGGAADNIEELLNACFILARAAELLECEIVPLWQATLIEAAQRVELLAPEILDLAAVLARRKAICAFDPAVKRILRRVDARSNEFLSPLSPRCKNILADINAALRGDPE